jgi:hypothetical protein
VIVPEAGDTAPGPSSLPGAEAAPSPIGWLRATLSGIAILAIGAALLLYLPNWELTHLTGLSRNGRVAIAVATFLVLFFALAWVLRRLQARRVI